MCTGSNLCAYQADKVMKMLTQPATADSLDPAVPPGCVFHFPWLFPGPNPSAACQ